jgi:hypothetical protein
MWKEVALATAVLAAAPQFFHTPAPARAAAVAPVAGQTFAATCRDGQLLDSRPDPAWVSASFARDNCREPARPAALNGAKASRGEIVAAMAASKAYGAAANAFQTCIADFVAAKRLQAAQGARPLTSTDLIIENHRILLSQRSAERAQAQARAAIVAFNAYGSGCEDP